jgi:hypothetical protein
MYSKRAVKNIILNPRNLKQNNVLEFECHLAMAFIEIVSMHLLLLHAPYHIFKNCEALFN